MVLGICRTDQPRGVNGRHRVLLRQTCRSPLPSQLAAPARRSDDEDTLRRLKCAASQLAAIVSASAAERTALLCGRADAQLHREQHWLLVILQRARKHRAADVQALPPVPLPRVRRVHARLGRRLHSVGAHGQQQN